MASNDTKFIYSKKTVPPVHPFQVVIKEHNKRKVLYITYGGGRKSGGGAWSENLNNVNPRTINMINDYLGEKCIEDIQKHTKSRLIVPDA